VSRLHVAVLVLAAACVLTVQRVPAQSRPKLTDYFTAIPETMVDASYLAQIAPSVLGVQDLDGDGNQDLVVLGFVATDKPCCGTPQPGRVLLGDGNGHFAIAPTSLFPVDTLKNIFPSTVLFADFNADGRPDMFIGNSGYDADPFPGEQNRLYLSRPEGGWQDASDTLPRLADYTHSLAVGDISGRGVVDLFVGNLRAIRPYTLLNTGSGQFTQTSANLPMGANQVFDYPGHGYRGSTLADLNGDGLPELIIAAEASSAFKTNHHSTILWNRDGVFVDTDKTELPGPGILAGTRADYDIEPIDVNQDGLTDLVLVGTQVPNYAGWFVQVFINKGNRQFVDETAARVSPEDASGGFDGLKFSGAGSIAVLDFNQDGAPDFFLNFSSGGRGVTRDLPLVWLNDGTGHFSTLKSGDFVAPGNEQSLGPSPRLVATRNGYSFIAPIGNGAGLRVRGLLATKPYRTTPNSSALHR
jgi:hypothetical protein